MKSAPPIERMAHIYGMLLRGEFVNCTEVAMLLEISRKQAHRDLCFMIDRIRLPIEYNQSRYTYILTADTPRPWWLLRPGDKDFVVSKPEAEPMLAPRGPSKKHPFKVAEDISRKLDFAKRTGERRKNVVAARELRHDRALFKHTSLKDVV